MELSEHWTSQRDDRQHWRHTPSAPFIYENFVKKNESCARGRARAGIGGGGWGKWERAGARCRHGAPRRRQARLGAACPGSCARDRGGALWNDKGERMVGGLARCQRRDSDLLGGGPGWAAGSTTFTCALTV